MLKLNSALQLHSIGIGCRRSLLWWVRQQTMAMASDAQLPSTLFEYNKADVPAVEFNLGRGAPSEDVLRQTAVMMQRATQHRLERDLAADSAASLLQYGAPAGDPAFLRQLQAFLQQQYRDDVQLCDLVTTAGASSGLFYTLNSVFPDKCPVLCEELTYMIAAESLRYLKYDIVSVGMDDDGINMDSLSAALQSLSDLPVNADGFRALLYLVPTFHNPTGRTLSPAKCMRVVQLARQHRVLVLCDDVYNLLYYANDRPPRRLFAYDRKSDADYTGNVVSNGSFSKYLAPGLRVGWMELPAWFKRRHWDLSPVLDSGGCLSMYTSGVLASALELRLVADQLHDLRHDYKQRMAAAKELFAQQLPDSCRVEIPEGGYFIWLWLPEHLSALRLNQLCMQEHSLKVMPGERFCADASRASERFGHCVRLSISCYDQPRLCLALGRLCTAVKQLLAADSLRTI